MSEVTLCQHTHQEAVKGACPTHGGDACLRQYAPVTASTHTAIREPDQLEEIRQHYEQFGYLYDSLTRKRVAWLIAELNRLRT